MTLITEITLMRKGSLGPSRYVGFSYPSSFFSAD